MRSYTAHIVQVTGCTRARLRTLVFVSVAAVSLMAAAASSRETVIEYRCGVSGPDSPTTPDGDVPIVRVLALGASEPLQLPEGADPKKHFISCARSLLVPSVNDVKVLEAGFKLFIGAPEKGSEDVRMAFMEGSKPDISFSVVKGRATREEERITEKVLKAINGR